MKWHRIKALIIRQLYLYPRSFPRLMDVFLWPILELLVWGFLSVYLERLNLNTVNILALLLGAMIFWELLNRSQSAVTIGFLEDVWEKNLLNLFVTPVRVIEFLLSGAALGLIRIVMQGVILGVVALILYGFNIFQYGLYTIPFVISLLWFGWIMGLFVVAIILRFGTTAQVLAFGVIFLIQPFSAVFYPVSALPQWIQWLSYMLPSTYVFEGMRAIVSSGAVSGMALLISFALNAAYMALVFWFFYSMFRKVKERGLLLKLDQ
ncbi:MAG: ABC transporter permease [Patescibacteria group bacterium]|nr:ABC transporter permease [Patescibacteria group bacterium]MDE1940722.1 ABC transporter permease [Patescibacteria group bacterium]MDE1966676.1 ABC transporter permease [Patescibacteria group bacterium]